MYVTKSQWCHILLQPPCYTYVCVFMCMCSPRVCLGRRFAQIEIIIVLASLVRNFTITPKDPSHTMETLLQPKNGLSLTPVNPVELKFTPREVQT